MDRSTRFLVRGALLHLLLLTACDDGDVTLEFVGTVTVLPDASYQHGGFVRVNHVPATDSLLATFGAESTTTGEGNGFVYKEYTDEMEETGRSGRFFWDQSGDMGSVMVENTYYFVTFPLFPDDGPVNGLRITRFDAASMEQQDSILMTLPGEHLSYPNNDPMVAWANGQLDVSTQYNPTGEMPDIFAGTGTYHHFYDADLNSLGEQHLTDTPHIVGSSLAFVDGVYHLVSAQAFIGGDLVVMHYDEDWQFLGSKPLGVGQAHWSTGLAFDGTHFFVAYLDNSRWAFPAPTVFPIYLNAHLAVFDEDWNLIADVAATDFSSSNQYAAGRPWVLLHGGRAYLAYDVDRLDPSEVPAEQFEGEAWVSIYDMDL